MNSQQDFPLTTHFDASYPASKAALNGLTLAMAIELEVEGIKVHAGSPGYTKTRLTGFAGTDIVEQGASEAVRLALLACDGPTGTLSHARMGEIPW